MNEPLWARFILEGQVRGGKNHMQINFRTGTHYPTPEFAAWRNRACAEIMAQKRDMLLYFRSKKGVTVKLPFDQELACDIDYTPSDNRRRDIPAILDAIFHVLERSGIVADDALIKHIAFRTRQKDARNPRAIIVLEPCERYQGGDRI